MSYLYLEGFRDAIEAAAKVCEDRTDMWMKKRAEGVSEHCIKYATEADTCADTIRALLPPPPGDKP